MGLSDHLVIIMIMMFCHTSNDKHSEQRDEIEMQKIKFKKIIFMLF